MNILKSISSFLLIGTVLIALPGFKRRSKPVEILDLPTMEESADYTEIKQGITLQAKRLNKPEAEQILGNRAGRLWHQSKLRKAKRRRKQRTCRSRKTEQIIPIQLSIKNQTNRTVALETEDIDLQLTDGKTVAKRLQRWSFAPAVITVLVGTALVGVVTAGISYSALWLWFAPLTTAAANVWLAATGGACIVNAFLVIGTPVVATGKVVQTAREGRRIRGAIKKHNFETMIQVEPDQSINTLIFVAEDDYKETFDINVQNEDNSHSVPFNVKIKTSDHLLMEKNDEENDKPSD